MLDVHQAFEYSQSMWDHVEMENYRMLADEALNLQTKLVSVMTHGAGLFYTFCAFVYLWSLMLRA